MLSNSQRDVQKISLFTYLLSDRFNLCADSVLYSYIQDDWAISFVNLG